MNNSAYLAAAVKHQGFLKHCISIWDIDQPTGKRHTIEQARWLNLIIQEASKAMLSDKYNYHGSLIGIVRLCLQAHYGYEAAPDAPFMEVFKTEYDYQMNNYKAKGERT